LPDLPRYFKSKNPPFLLYRGLIIIRDFLENRWAVGILILAAFAGVLALVSHFGLVEGTIMGDGTGSDGCEPGWFTPTHPGTQEPYTSTDALREDVLQNTGMNETQVDRYMSNVELRNTENGTILQKEEVCA